MSSSKIPTLNTPPTLQKTYHMSTMKSNFQTTNCKVKKSLQFSKRKKLPTLVNESQLSNSRLQIFNSTCQFLETKKGEPNNENQISNSKLQIVKNTKLQKTNIPNFKNKNQFHSNTYQHSKTNRNFQTTNCKCPREITNPTQNACQMPDKKTYQFPV